MDEVVIVGTGGLSLEVACWFADVFEVVGYLKTDDGPVREDLELSLIHI